MITPKSVKNLFSNRAFQYVLFWIISFIFLLNFFTKETEIQLIDMIYTSLFHISLVFAVSAHNFLLVPRLLAERRYTYYTLLLAGLLAISIWLNIATFRFLSDWLFPGYYFISYLQWWEILEFVVVYVAVTSLLEFSKSWFRELETQRRVEELEKEKVSAELKLLRAQINPHFLFNSLNHIYALAERNSDETGPAILQLSELLRYTIGNMDREQVPLRDEIRYLRQYVKLFKSRIHHPERVHFSVQGESSELQIVPMLLISFIENCFKHGSVKQEDEKIEIGLSVADNKLEMNTLNTVDPERELPADSGGLGLENVRRRLNLLYPGKHELNINWEVSTFRVHLAMELL